jgi:HEAT repeat protein
VISGEVLTLVMWLVIALWLGTVAIIIVEFHARNRHDARSATLMEQLTASALMTAEALPDVSRSEFQELVLAGLPDSAQIALAQELRSQGGDEALVGLVTGAKRGSIDERIEALQIIVSGRHPDMYRILGEALHSSHAELANVALRLLRALNDQQAAHVLIDALGAGAGSASRIAAALNRLTVSYGAFLGPLLEHESPTVRFWAVLLVGRTGASQWATGVRRLITDREPMVRRAAVESLGRIGSSDDRRHVLGRFFDPSAMVRVHAARAAVAYADTAVADAVARLLSDREWIVRAAARESLRAMGRVSTPAAVRVLWQGDPFAANNAAEVLFLTGEAIRLIREVVNGGGTTAQTKIVERLIAASGPQIVRALNDQLDSVQQSALERLLGAHQPMVAVRNR